MDIVQVRPVPLQSPPHPANVAPEAGISVSVTAVPVENVADWVPVVTLIPVGELLTVPPPVPARVTMRVFVVGVGAGALLNVAVTE